MNFRRILFWGHLITGVVAGLVILVMCVTGVLLGFERQINDWADAAGRVPVKVTGTRTSLTSILGSLGERVKPTAVTIYSDPQKPVAIAAGRERTLFFDPGTGEELGNGSKATREFFSTVERFHRAFGEALQKRGPGRFAIDASNLLFLGLIVSGMYLWLPKAWHWTRVRSSLFYRGGLSGKARNWNWHNVTGIWCAIPLFFIVLCSVIMSYQWANNLLYRASGTEPPKAGAGRLEARPIKSDIANLDALFAVASKQVNGWQSISLRLDSPRTAAFTIDRGNGGQPDKRDQLVLDRKSGEIIRWEPFSSQTLGRKLRILARFTHTGEAWGILGQIIATIATAGGAFLVWTGLALALHRFRKWRIRRTNIGSAAMVAETSLAD
jgi:uncharacterized iron-regulated membrane protein